MTEQIYLRGVVIANGIPDSDDDSLNSQEIRTILSKFEEQQNDVQHDRIHYDGVHTIENWMTDSEIEIQGKTVPQNSWCATVKVTNSEIIKAVENQELTCFSLGSVSKKAKTRDSWFINKRISYHDLKSIEDVIPLFISIVDAGANGFPFEVLDYDAYINKSKAKDENTMTEETTQNQEARFSFKEWLGIEKHFKENVVEKAEETVEEPTETAEQNIQALFDKIDSLASEIAEIKEILSAEDVEKAEEDEKEKEEEDEEKVEKEDESSKSESDDVEKAEDEEEKKDDEEINKRQTKKSADANQSIDKSASSTFFSRTKRDIMGRKIRD